MNGEPKARGTLGSTESQAHFHPGSDVHADHQEDQEAKRLRGAFKAMKSLFWMDARERIGGHTAWRLQNEKIAMVVSRDGRELSLEDSNELFRERLTSRATYLADRGGKRTGDLQAKPVAKPLEYDTINMSPWHSLGCYISLKRGFDLKKDLTEILRKLTKRFEEITGYENVSTALHLKFFNLHFAISYVKVDANGKKLGRTGRGHGRLGRLSNSLIGARRLRRAGFDLEEVTRCPNASANLDRLMATKGGKDRIVPFDQKLCDFLDLEMNALVERRPELKSIFEGAFGMYRELKERESATYDEIPGVRELSAKANAQANRVLAQARTLAEPYSKLLAEVNRFFEQYAVNQDAAWKALPDLLKRYFTRNPDGRLKMKLQVKAGFEILAEDPEYQRVATDALAQASRWESPQRNEQETQSVIEQGSYSPRKTLPSREDNRKRPENDRGI